MVIIKPMETSNIQFKKVKARPKINNMYSSNAGNLVSMLTLLQYQARTQTTIGK